MHKRPFGKLAGDPSELKLALMGRYPLAFSSGRHLNNSSSSSTSQLFIFQFRGLAILENVRRWSHRSSIRSGGGELLGWIHHQPAHCAYQAQRGRYEK